jgi:hypothetical protein
MNPVTFLAIGMGVRSQESGVRRIAPDYQPHPCSLLTAK